MSLDGVVVDVADVEVADAEYGREHGAGKCGTASDGLVLVESDGERFARE